ncbi:MAG: tetratricopeptide repeat protein [Candidatus Acidiferrales bacterium]
MVDELQDAPDIEKGLLLLNEAICLDRLDRLDEARRRLKEASALVGEDRSMRALVDSTDASFYMGRNPKKALDKFDSVSRRYADILHCPEERSQYGENQLRRGLLLVELKRNREARRVLEEVLTLDVEKNGDFYFSLGICYLALRENDLARQQFCEALRLGLPEQKLVDSHFYLGVAHFRMRGYARALHEFEFCETNIGKSNLPSRGVNKWLALTCRNLGLQEEAKRYAALGKKV